MNNIILRKGGKETVEAIAERLSDVATARSSQLGGPYHTVIRWGCTAPVVASRIVNKAKAISLVSNKTSFRSLVVDNNRSLAPKTWFSFTDEDIEFPVIVRSKKHARGNNFFVSNNYEELAGHTVQAGNGYYISKLINKTKEFRVFMVQGRVAAVSRKFVDDPRMVAWNHAEGGHSENVPWGEWPLKVVKYAREVFLLSGLDFGAVDVILDDNNNPYVLEINTSPEITSNYRQEVMAMCFEYILENGVGNIPVVENLGGWKKFIHPAISNEAIV